MLRKRIMICLLCVLLLLCACESVRGKDFYLKLDQDHSTTYSIDALIEKQVWDLEDNHIIPLRIGIGYDHMTTSTEGKVATLTVRAENCLINGEKDVWSQTYSDFFTDEKYKAEVEERWYAHDKLTPRYHSMIEIVLPEGEARGDIIIELSSSVKPNKVDSVEIDYIKNDSTVVFYDQYAVYGSYTYQEAVKLLESSQ